MEQSQGSLWIACAADALDSEWVQSKNIGALWCCVKQGTYYHTRIIAEMADLGIRRPELVLIDWSPCEGFTPSGERVINQVRLLVQGGVNVAVFCEDSKRDAPAALMMYLMVGAGLTRAQAEAAVSTHRCARVVDFQPQGALDAAEDYAQGQKHRRYDSDVAQSTSLSAAMLQSAEQLSKSWQRNTRRSKTQPVRSCRSLSPCEECILTQEDQAGAFYASESQFGVCGFTHHWGVQHEAALPKKPSLKDCFGASVNAPPSAVARTSGTGAVERPWCQYAGRNEATGLAAFTPKNSWRSVISRVVRSAKVLPDEATHVPHSDKTALAHGCGDCAEDFFFLMEERLVEGQLPIEAEAADNNELAGTDNLLPAHVPRGEKVSDSTECMRSLGSAKEGPNAETNAPLILNIVSPTPHAICAGEYHLVEGRRPNGQPLWQKQGDGPRRWLYSSTDGVWTVGDKDEMRLDFQSTNGFIAALQPHCGAMPHTQVRWGHATFGQGMSEDPQITVAVQSAAQAKAQRKSERSVKLNPLLVGNVLRNFSVGTVSPGAKASLHRLSNVAPPNTIEPTTNNESLGNRWRELRTRVFS